MKKGILKKVLLAFVLVVLVALVAVGFSGNRLSDFGQCGNSVWWEYDSAKGQLYIFGEGDMYDYDFLVRSASPFYNTGIKTVIIEDNVTSIGNRAFSGCKWLRSVTVPDSVTEIGISAFEGCKRFESIELPDKLVKVERNTFDGCVRLKEITLPDGVTEIESSAFSYCEKLEKINIPEGVTAIGYSAFRGCKNLKEIKLPDSLKKIEAFAFGSCSSLTGIEIPDGVEIIEICAFNECTGLSELNMPDSIEKAESLIFYNTAYYNDSKNWSDGVLYIGNHLVDVKEDFSGTLAVKEGTLTVSGVFGCEKLTAVTVPDSVKYIDSGTFEDCTALKDITLSKNLVSIGESAFLNTAYYNDESNWEKGVLYIDNCLIAANEKISDKYEIKEGTRLIADYAFRESNVVSLVLPEGSEIIGNSAFDCYSLKNITLPESLKVIGKEAFADCSNLTEISVPAGVREIGDNAFYGCSSLTDIYFGAGEKEWKNIDIGYTDEDFEKITIHFTETE